MVLARYVGALGRNTGSVREGLTSGFAGLNAHRAHALDPLAVQRCCPRIGHGSSFVRNRFTQMDVRRELIAALGIRASLLPRPSRVLACARSARVCLVSELLQSG
jgi:hypothetical protein